MRGRAGWNVVSAALTLLILGAADAGASDWTRFRGPNGTGLADEKNLPVDLSPDSALWSREVSFGRSSPVVQGGIVYLTGLDDSLVTAAFDAATGDEMWVRSVSRRRVDEVDVAAGPSIATPAADENGVYSFFPEFGLVAYDRDGTERWTLELPPFRSYYGLASSPVLEAGLLLLVCDQSQNPYVLAVDTETGEEKWRRPRVVRGESWTTPVIHRAGTDAARLLTFGTLVVDAYEVGTGAHDWQLPGFGVTPVSSPLLSGSSLFVAVPAMSSPSAPGIDAFAARDSDGDGRLTAAEYAIDSPLGGAFEWLDVNGDGFAAFEEIEGILEVAKSNDFGLVAVDLASDGGPRIRWRQQKTIPYIATPILVDGVLFLVNDGGILTSYDPATGEVLKRGRIEGVVEPFSPSPIASGGRLYLSSSVGSVAVVSAQAQWDLLAVSDLDEEIFASPAVADGRLFIRTRSSLYAFGPR